MDFFICQDFLKKIQHLAFTDKVKIVKSYLPEKAKLFIETNFFEELSYFQKKYQLKIEIVSDKNLILPEYKIEQDDTKVINQKID